MDSSQIAKKGGTKNPEMKVIQAVVSPTELTYLLSLVGANCAFGIDDALWQDNTDTSLGARLDQGFDSLVQNGWLEVEGEATGRPRYTINPNLITMAATLADPNLVIVTQRYMPNREAEVATHYITDHLLLEQVQRADHSFRLMSLPAHSAMIDRLALSLGLLDKASQANLGRVGLSGSVDLNWTKVSALDQMIQHRSGYAAVREAGVAEAEAAILEEIFTNASPIAKIEMGRTFGARLLSLQTMILFEVDGELWSVHSGEGQQTLALEKLNKPRFTQIMVNAITKLAEIEPVRL